ncbi:MAG TPA: hypothetical protein VNV43_00845 [Candidatus Acidoferrales bacterium]|jgi:hypothetical protein|nr:hypothetical protein [Candidatus Acidoferrales bacterium]
MNVTELQRKLIAAARANAPDDRVPYAFEKRVIALIPGMSPTNDVALWVRGLWQAAASCVVVAALCGAWAFFNPASNSGDDLSQNLETTLLASVDQGDQAQ